MEVSEEELRSAIERAFQCKPVHAGAERVTESFAGKPAWDGIVHIFELAGHATASRAYAWTSPIEGSTKRRFYTVLGTPPINSAADAVRAAIVAERKATSR